MSFKLSGLEPILSIVCNLTTSNEIVRGKGGVWKRELVAYFYVKFNIFLEVLRGLLRKFCRSNTSVGKNSILALGILDRVASISYCAVDVTLLLYCDSLLK